MKPWISGLAILALALTPVGARAVCYPFTQEHVDLLSVRCDASGNVLDLMASDDSHGTLYAGNQCVVVCPDSMRFTLPAGTPLGNEGESLWILPQNAYAGVPYVGVSAEAVPAGLFSEAFSIRLTRLEGPGQLLLWQAGSFGGIDVKMDTRDGVGPEDSIALPVGGHAHYNWGFSTSGVYRAYFQASGRRGNASAVVSPETPFTFHVLPLRPFELWTATNWPCECAGGIIAPGADPDADGIVNVLEYAWGIDPRVGLRTNLPTVTFVVVGDARYGALRYVLATNATDLIVEARVAGMPGGASRLLTDVSTNDGGATRTITARDFVPKASATNRFYQLRVRLDYP